MASAAEKAGWDGFFVWEPIWGIDAWVTLTVAATRTEKIRLGTMISPLSRMRPWKLASEALTVDRLSKGRVIISVGLGALDSGFNEFGEEADRKTRAELSVGADGEPSLELSDRNGKTRAALGQTDLKVIRTGSTEKRPPASLVLFDEKGTVIWEAP